VERSNYIFCAVIINPKRRASLSTKHSMVLVVAERIHHHRRATPTKRASRSPLPRGSRPHYQNHHDKRIKPRNDHRHQRPLPRLLVLVASAVGLWCTVQLPYSIFFVTPPHANNNDEATTLVSSQHHQEMKQPMQRICETTKLTFTTTNGTASSSSSSSSIAAYLSRMEHPEDWLLLKWNSDGSFALAEAQAKTYYQQWAPSADLLGETVPSPLGRLVLLFNSDRIPQVPWQLRPPVPVWVYSKPTSAADPRLWNISAAPLEECVLEGVTVVPNPYDFGTWNDWCVQVIDQKMTQRNFTDKINQVIWRGAVHSKRVEQSRTALLEYGRRHRAAQGDNNQNGTNVVVDDWLNVQEVNKKGDPYHLELHELANYRYHLDLGGVSGTAWGGLRWKLCTGLLVFKVQSWSNDWWYDTLVPWVHYIPIRADVSDLQERYQWTQDHPDRAEAIAQAGQAQCRLTLGPDAAKKAFRTAVQSIQAADQALVSEANEILEQLSRLGTDMVGLPSIVASSRP
jgi:hypothetical protein